MKTNRLLILLFTLLSSMTCLAGISDEVKFSTTPINTQEVEFDGVTYTKLTMEGCDQVCRAGELCIPVKYISYSIPYNATNIKLDYTVKRQALHMLSHPIYQNSSEPGGIELGGGIVPNPQNEFAAAKIYNIGFVEGSNHVVTVELMPIIPTTNGLTYYSIPSITYNITWDTEAEPSEGSQIPLASSNSKVVKEGIELTKTIVANPDDVEMNIYTKPVAYTTDQEDYDYIIIAPSRLCHSLQRLASMRRNKGFGSAIFSIEQIISNPRFAQGDEISGINDDAGKLRQFLKWAYQVYGTKYVLLAGKYPEMPIRYLTNSKFCKNGSLPNAYVIPSDLYFADLDTPWTLFEDEIYYQESKKIDLYNELVVGRIPFENSEEVDNYIDKLIIYEQNPGLGDTSYLSRAFVSKQDFITTNKTNSHLKTYGHPSQISAGIPWNTVVTVYGKNTLPYILPLYLDGYTVYSSTERYISCNEAFVGSMIRPDSQPVQILNKAVLEIYATGDVYLMPSLEMDNESRLVVNSSKKVKVNNISMMPGATLIINAPNVDITDTYNNSINEDVTVIINGVLRKQSRQLRAENNTIDSHNSFVVEGKTWWYYNKFIGVPGRTGEYGLRIGECVEINGVGWNALNLVNALQFVETSEGTDIVKSNDSTIAYIREQDNKVFICFPSLFDVAYWPIAYEFDSYCSFEDLNNFDVIQIYDFNVNEGETYNYGTTDSYMKVAASNVSEMVNSGINYITFSANVAELYNASYVYENLPRQIVDGIGVVDHDIFTSPFTPVAGRLGSYNANSRLRYVTDKDNQVIYEGDGGFQLWNYAAGVDDIKADNSNSAKYFNLQGVEIERPESGVYIRVDGGQATKVVIR